MHMTKKSNLIDYKRCKGPSMVFGDDSKGNTFGKKDLIIGDIKIQNILHVDKRYTVGFQM